MQVAVDGPSGSGKSTICKILAEKYDLLYLDTGAMYRGASYIKLQHGLTYPELYKILEHTVFNFYDKGRGLVLEYFYNKTHTTDVSTAIRGPEVTALVSEVSADETVRKILTEKQQSIAAGADVILDGRDIGTVVLPQAEIKFFLTATAEERARRREEEWKGKGINVEFAEVLRQIIERDRKDSTRQTAPLKKAEDAIELDTTHLTIPEVAGIIGAAVEKVKPSAM